MICDGCPYNKYMSTGFSCTGIVQVPSRSNRYKEPYQAPLMIIGEVPQPGETVSGQILTSRGADIVWKTLQKFELPYEQRPGQAYGTTLFKCAVVKKKSTEKYIPTAIQKCRALLQKEIQQVNPKMILTLGAEATKAVTGQEALKITQVQGTIMQCPYLPEATVIPLPHPAKMLHAPGEYKVFSQIMTYVASVYKSSANILDPGETDYWVVNTEDKFYRSLGTIDSHIKKRPFPFLACDIETNRLNPRTEGGRILVMGVQFATNKVFVYTPEVFHLLPVLFKGNYWFTWHNGKFDTAWWEERGYHVLNVQDVMLMHYSMNEASGTHDLEQLSQIFLGAQAYKSTANQYLKHPDGMGSAPKEVLYERVAVDCDYTGQLAEQFYPKVLSDPNLNKLYHNILMPGSDFLQSMEAIGMAIDPGKLNELGLKYEKQLEELNAQVIEGVGDAWDPDLYQDQTGAKSASAVFKPSSPKQLAWLIYDRLQIRPKRRSKRSTEAEILESIDNPPQFITDLLKYRTVAKEFSTYVTGILKRVERDGRTHGTYQLHITSTGRLSCKDPNLQNIPSIRKDIRRAFIAEPGNVLMECDYKGAELRVLAVLSGVGALGRALIAGQDLHDDLARKYWGENFTKADRMKAKTINFGVPYGREAYSVAQELNITVSEAQALIDHWAEMYPEAWLYLEECAKTALRGEPLVTPLGRYRRFGLITEESAQSISNEAKNFKIQSVSSDLTLLSGIQLYKELRNTFGARVINIVHDSLVIECKDKPEIILGVAETVKRVMSATPIKWLNAAVPFGVDVELGYNWADIVDLKYYVGAGHSVAGALTLKHTS